MNCPRCRAHVVSGVVHLEDGPDGLYAVTAEPVATHTHTCGCGAHFTITSTQPCSVHPGQLRLIRGAA